MDVQTPEKNLFEFHTSWKISNAYPIKRTIKKEPLIDKFADFYEKWITIESKFSESVNTFFYYYASTKNDINDKFINYLFALEQYHKTKLNTKVKLRNGNERDYEEAIQKTNGSVRKIIEKIFEEKKEPRLEYRLRELVNLVSEHVNIVELDYGKLIATRHYLVHLDKKYESKCYKPNEIYEVNRMLANLYLTLLKKDIFK
jgi:hypothetical protein